MKVEYEWTPKLAEDAMLEFYEMTDFKYRRPVFVAIVFAVVWFSLFSSGTVWESDGHDYHTQANIVIAGVIGVLVWICALIYKSDARQKVINQIRTLPNVAFGRHEFSWNESGVTVTSAAGSHYIVWQMIDKISVYGAGIHFLRRKQKLFSVPKIALSDSQLSNLIETFRRVAPAASAGLN
jgi:hypothetical protein